MQQNDHGPFLPLLAAAVKPAMNDVVFRELAWSGRGKAKMERAIEFDLCRLTVVADKLRTRQQFERFLQPGWLRKVRGHHQCHSLNSQPVHQFCQRRYHALFFLLASNLWQMMDAAAINRLFISKNPRIPVVVTARVVIILDHREPAVR